MNMNNLYDIQGMNISKEAKIVFERIEQAAKVSRDSFKKAIPSVFLVGNKGAGSSCFANMYEYILASNHVYRVRGAKTFLELVFPKDGSEIDYQRFYQSPKIVASLQNRFYGVFAISLEEWEGKDLLESNQFRALLDFVDNNKDTIFFVFQITNTFKAKEELKRTLNNHINMIEVQLGYPDSEMAVEYIRTYLKREGIEFSEEGRKALSQFLQKRVNMNSTTFAGYHSLQQIAKSIQFELLTEDLAENKRMHISEDILRNIESRVIIPEPIESKSRSIGFGV